MKKRIISGGGVIVLGLLIALGPQFLFKVCGLTADGGFTRCHWSAQAEIGIGGILIAGLGIALILFANPRIRQSVSYCSPTRGFTPHILREKRNGGSLRAR
jgi:hypothetical protein